MDAFERSDSIVCIVADTLAYAATRGIPFADALRNLPFYTEPKLTLKSPAALNEWLCVQLPALYPMAWGTDSRFRARARRLIEELDKGEPLSYAVEAALGRWVPAYFVLGLEKAENQGRVAAVLPALAASLSYPRAVTRERASAFVLAIARVLVTMPILFGLSVFILPKLTQMEYELLGAQGNYFHQMGAAASVLLPIMHWAVIGSLLVFLVTRIDVIGERVILWIPFVRRDCLRMRVADMTRGMLAFTRTGEDVLTAAEWTYAATRSPWMARRLKAFIEAVSAGRNWAAAWQEMRLGVPLADWLVHNAAAREDPASAFELLLDKCILDTQRTTCRLHALVDPVCVLLLGVMVGAVAYGAFSFLARLVDVGSIL